MIRNAVGQIEATEPPICEGRMYLFAQTPFRPDAEAITPQKHADQQLGIDRRSASVAVEISRMRADATQPRKRSIDRCR